MKNLAFLAILAAAGVSIFTRGDVEPGTAPDVTVAKADRITWISQNGDSVEIKQHLATDGGWTIIEFTGDW